MTTRDTVINHTFNLQIQKAKWWEKLVLHFIDLEVYEEEGIVITYKRFHDRLYIYNTRRETYQLSEPFNGGINKPWAN